MHFECIFEYHQLHMILKRHDDLLTACSNQDVEGHLRNHKGRSAAWSAADDKVHELREGRGLAGT